MHVLKTTVSCRIGFYDSTFFKTSSAPFLKILMSLRLTAMCLRVSHPSHNTSLLRSNSPPTTCLFLQMPEHPSANPGRNNESLKSSALMRLGELHKYVCLLTLASKQPVTATSLEECLIVVNSKPCMSCSPTPFRGFRGASDLHIY